MLYRDGFFYALFTLHSSLFTFHFSLFTFHFSLFTFEYPLSINALILLRLALINTFMFF